MKNIFVIAISIMAPLASCTKDNHTIPQHDNAPLHAIFMDGEDDERKILMKIFNDSMTPLPDAFIYATDGTDIITGRTDTLGHCLIDAGYSRKWTITVSHPDYAAIQKEVYLSDSVTEINCIMKY